MAGWLPCLESFRPFLLLLPLSVSLLGFGQHLRADKIVFAPTARYHWTVVAWRRRRRCSVFIIYSPLSFFLASLSQPNQPTNQPTDRARDRRAGNTSLVLLFPSGARFDDRTLYDDLDDDVFGTRALFYFTRRWENTLRGAGLMRRGTSTKFGTGLYVQVTVFWMCTTCFRRGLVTNKPVFDGAGASCGGAFFPWDKERALALLGLQTDRLVFGDGECCWCGCLGTRGGLLLWFLLYMYRTYLPNSGGENSCQ